MPGNAMVSQTLAVTGATTVRFRPSPVQLIIVQVPVGRRYLINVPEPDPQENKKYCFCGMHGLL